MPITEGGRFSPENRIVSPGVFTRENDLSGVAQGVADIGAVVVAPFPKGPGFSPMLLTNSSDLQNIFGIPDGTYYGPYTANEYLLEKGFVTVVRVGALTGYNQKHPLVIYAQSGRWERLGSAGAIDSEYSFVLPSGSISDGYAAGIVINSTSGAYTGIGSGNITFVQPDFEFTLQTGAGDTSDYSSASIASNSGSLLFNNQAVSFKTNSDSTFDANIEWEGTGETTTFAQLLTKGTTVTGSFVDTELPLFAFGIDPFDTDAVLISGSFTVDNQSGCTLPIFRIHGILSGAFGKYDGTFNADPVIGVDNCGNFISSSAKLLAVLADTQAGGIDTNLNAPGFSGSTVSTSGVLNADSSSISQNYTLNLVSTGDGEWGSYEFSLSKATNKYITNVFGTNATAGNPATQVQGQKIEAAYLHSIFEDSIAEVAANPDRWSVAVAAPIDVEGPFSSGAIEPLIFTDKYSLAPTTGDSAYSLTHAITPWIVSQAVAGVNNQSHRFELFKVHTLSDGTNTNTAYKIEISNVKLAGTVAGTNWGTFTLAVRAFSDTENRPVYLEQFQNLTLDPTSPNFISRKIGDRYNYITSAGKILEFGTYNNLSKYIRIEASTINYPTSAIPYGFEPYIVPFGGSVTDGITPTVKYTKASTWTNGPGRYASGLVFGETLSVDSELSGLYPTSNDGAFIYNDNLQYFDAIPAGASIGQNTGFYLDIDYTTSNVGTSVFISSSNNGAANAIPAIYDAANEATYVKMRKFILGFQGGFDGQSPAIPINIGSDIIAGNTQGLNCATSTTAGSVAYNQCLGALSNADEFDINLLVTPGIFHSLHSYVAQLGINLCEQRGDCFYIMDNIVFPNTTQPVDMITAAINDVSTIDSNYVATYYPWIKVLDTNINQIVNLPPSVLMPSIYASNDAASAEWFAPAGLNRGGIPQATGVLDKLTIGDRDNLYEGRVNPIASFPGQGICVWGQKTLQIKHSALDRVNVRRLLIALKKFIAASSKYLVFEQNVASTRNRFLSIVNPYLESVQQRSGLYAYKVVMDETNNTPDIIDNNQLYGQIYLQPAKTAEFIILDFNILPTGAQFPGA